MLGDEGMELPPKSSDVPLLSCDPPALFPMTGDTIGADKLEVERCPARTVLKVFSVVGLLPSLTKSSE